MPATMNQLIKLRNDLCRYCRNLPAVPNNKFVELVNKFDEIMTIAYRDGYQRLRQHALVEAMVQPRIQPNPAILIARTLQPSRMLQGTHAAGEAATANGRRARQPAVDPAAIQNESDLRRAFGLQDFNEEDFGLQDFNEEDVPDVQPDNNPVPEDEEL